MQRGTANIRFDDAKRLSAGTQINELGAPILELKGQILNTWRRL